MDRRQSIVILMGAPLRRKPRSATSFVSCALWMPIYRVAHETRKALWRTSWLAAGQGIEIGLHLAMAVWAVKLSSKRAKTALELRPTSREPNAMTVAASLPVLST